MKDTRFTYLPIEVSDQRQVSVITVTGLHSMMIGSSKIKAYFLIYEWRVHSYESYLANMFFLSLFPINHVKLLHTPATEPNYTRPTPLPLQNLDT